MNVVVCPVEFLLAQLLSASVVLVGDVQPGSLPLEVIYGSTPDERCDGLPTSQAGVWLQVTCPWKLVVLARECFPKQVPW